jgi:hypothetical protein
MAARAKRYQYEEPYEHQFTFDKYPYGKRWKRKRERISEKGKEEPR